MRTFERLAPWALCGLSLCVLFVGLGALERGVYATATAREGAATTRERVTDVFQVVDDCIALADQSLRIVGSQVDRSPFAAWMAE